MLVMGGWGSHTEHYPSHGLHSQSGVINRCPKESQGDGKSSNCLGFYTLMVCLQSSMKADAARRVLGVRIFPSVL